MNDTTGADQQAGDAERAELRQTLQRLLRDHCADADVRTVMETPEGYDKVLWQKISALGMPALAVPTEHDGLGYGWRELSVVLEELGASLYPGPFLSGALAGTALVHLASPDAQAELLPGIAQGDRLATFTTIARDTVAVEGLAGQGQRLTVTANLPLVLDAHVADVIVALAHTDEGAKLLHIDATTPGVHISPQLGMDLTRRFSDVSLDAATVMDVTSANLTEADLERLQALMLVAMAAEQVGGARRALADTVEYVKTRVQFGRAVGSFQAVKHRCADLAVDLAEAEACCAAAVSASESNSSDLLLTARLAAVVCADAYLNIARAMVQLHGGVGFTWEHSAHLHFKRAKTSQLFGGSPAEHRRMLGEQLGLRRADVLS
jgi:alkylation response protein AidB-like acyl-CoA dehydrogenase